MKLEYLIRDREKKFPFKFKAFRTVHNFFLLPNFPLSILLYTNSLSKDSLTRVFVATARNKIKVKQKLTITKIYARIVVYTYVTRVRKNDVTSMR